MSLYSASCGVSKVKKVKTGVSIKGNTWITWQTALLNCARVGRTGILAGSVFQ